MALARELSNGLRLYKPENTACSDKMYVQLTKIYINFSKPYSVFFIALLLLLMTL